MSAAAVQRADAATLARGAVVNFIGNFGRLSRAVSFMLIAWLFGAETLGLYLLAWAATEFIRRFVSYGQEPAVVFYLSRALADNDDERGARIVASSLLITLATGVAGGLFLWCAKGFVATTLLTEPRTLLAFSPFVFAIPSFGIIGTLLAATRAKKVMRYEVIARSFVEPFTLLVGTILAWAFDLGLFGLALAQTTALWLSALVCFTLYGSLYSLRGLLRGLKRPTEIARIVRYATPVAGRDVLAQGVARIDLFIVGHVLDAAAAGVYGIAVEVASLSRYARQALEPIFAPLIVEQHYRAERERLSHTYRNATRWALLVNLVVFGIAALAGGTFLKIYGSAFAAGGTALAILVLGQTINGVFGLSEMMLLMIGRPALTLANVTLLLTLIGTLDYTFVHLWGITGAAIGTASATAFVVFLQVLQVRRRVGVHPLRKALVKPLLACSGALLLSWIVPLWKLPADVDHLLRAALFVALYFILLMQLGLEEEERRLHKWVKAHFAWTAPSASTRR